MWDSARMFCKHCGTLIGEIPPLGRMVSQHRGRTVKIKRLSGSADVEMTCNECGKVTEFSLIGEPPAEASASSVLSASVA